MVKAGCPDCKEIIELKEDYEKWNGKQIYKCSKCGTLLLKCWGCDRMTKVHNFWDEAYCDQCTPKVMRNAVGIVATVALGIFSGGKIRKT